MILLAESGGGAIVKKQSMTSIKYVQEKENRWNCPGCEYSTDKIVNLREHVGRHHDFRITTVPTWHLTKEQKRKSEKTKRKGNANEGKPKRTERFYLILMRH